MEQFVIVTFREFLTHMPYVLDETEWLRLLPWQFSVTFEEFMCMQVVAPPMLIGAPERFAVRRYDPGEVMFVQLDTEVTLEESSA
jgi:hypothetical protein